MFGLSWTQIGIIVVVGVFVLGPERIPTAVRFVTDGATKLRGLASGAQDGLRREIGPELEELRRQVAELQGLRELIDLRELHPQRLIGGAFSAASGPIPAPDLDLRKGASEPAERSEAVPTPAPEVGPTVAR